MTAVSNSSLVSKSLSTEAQGTFFNSQITKIHVLILTIFLNSGLGQGVRRLMSYLGLVIGPLWAGAAARKPVLLMGVAIGLTILNLVNTLNKKFKLELHLYNNLI